MTIGLHFVCALEQFAPSDAVALAVEAEGAGFDGIVVSDRFQPWLPTQGEASFAWTVLGAIGARTAGALAVTAVPGYRMHPSAVAQASATTAALFPGRHRLMLSAGDAIDEHVVGAYWPEAAERSARLFEAWDLMRKLFATTRRGSDARHRGEHFRLESARLWTAPAVPPPVLIWAGGPVTARRAGRVADGVVVASGSIERVHAIVRAAADGAAEAGRPRPHIAVHHQIAWADDDAAALEGALRHWPMAGMRFPRGDIRSPFDVEQLARGVSPDDLRARVTVSADPDLQRERLRELVDLRHDDGARAVDAIHLHNLTLDQRGWFEVFARDVRPGLAP